MSHDLIKQCFGSVGHLQLPMILMMTVVAIVMIIMHIKNNYQDDTMAAIASVLKQ